MNKNSVKAYKEIKHDIPAKEREVLHMIKMYGPINGRMLDVRISGGHKRIKNLMDMGCIGIAYIADDAVTGRETNYYMWLTDKPNKVVKKTEKKDPLVASSAFDAGYRMGVRAAICYAIDKHGEKIDIETIEGVVDEVCEVML